MNQNDDDASDNEGEMLWGSFATSFPLVEELESIDRALRCPICYSLFKVASGFSTCSHVFCGDCISDWVQRSPSCPTCKREQSSSSIQFKPFLDTVASQFKPVRFLLKKLALYSKSVGIDLSIGTSQGPNNTTYSKIISFTHHLPLNINSKAISSYKPHSNTDKVQESNYELEYAPSDKSLLTPSQNISKGNQISNDISRVKLPSKVYHVMKDNQIKALLTELKLDISGNRARWIWRHKEYKRLHNLACIDVNRPMKTPKELRSLLKVKEQQQFYMKSIQSQEGRLSGSSSSSRPTNNNGHSVTNSQKVNDADDYVTSTLGENSQQQFRKLMKGIKNRQDPNKLKKKHSTTSCLSSQSSKQQSSSSQHTSSSSSCVMENKPMQQACSSTSITCSSNIITDSTTTSARICDNKQCPRCRWRRIKSERCQRTFYIDPVRGIGTFSIPHELYKDACITYDTTHLSNNISKLQEPKETKKRKKFTSAVKHSPSSTSANARGNSFTIPESGTTRPAGLINNLILPANNPISRPVIKLEHKDAGDSSLRESKASFDDRTIVNNSCNISTTRCSPTMACPIEIMSSSASEEEAEAGAGKQKPSITMSDVGQSPVRSSKKAKLNASSPLTSWPCSACTFENSAARTHCEICKSRRRSLRCN